MGIQEKRNTGCEIIDSQATLAGRLNVGDAIRESKRHLLDGGGTRLANVITTDGNGIPLRSVLAAKGKDVRDNSHRRAGRIDVRAPRDVLLQNVILNCARKPRERSTLPFGDGEIEREQNRRGGVDGHRGGNAFERDPLEESFHILEGIDGYSDAAHFSLGQRMIGVEADLGGKIKSYGKSSRPLREQITVA